MELYKRSLAIIGANQVNSEHSLLRKFYSLAINTLYFAYVVFDLMFQGLQECYIDDGLACTRVKADFYIFYSFRRNVGYNAKVGKSCYSQVVCIFYSRFRYLLDNEVVGEVVRCSVDVKSGIFFLFLRKSSLLLYGLLLSFG